MRILVIQETYLPLVGGAEWHVHYLTEHLLALGHEVEIVTGRVDDQLLAGHRDPCPVHRHAHAVGRKAWPWLPVWIARFVGLFRRFDLVHVHHPSFLCMAAVLAARLTGTPVVVTLHGLGALDSSVGGSWLRKLYRYASFRGVGRAIATSEEMHAVACRFLPRERVALITNGVDSAVFAPPAPRDFSAAAAGLAMVTVRRLAPKNGVQYAVEALARAGDRVGGTLRIIGDGVLKERITGLIERSGLAGRVRFEGFLARERIIEALAGCDVALFLSTAESTSLAALECMAMGCIVVASNAGALPDIVHDGETGLVLDLFEPGLSLYQAPEQLSDRQYETIIAALARLQASPPEHLRRLSDNARRFVVETFDWSVIVGRTVAEVYQPLLADEGRQ
jgi:glycosyltransferase involved in cell wall biosynthesis